jgi:predicted phosphoribosyltransferase
MLAERLADLKGAGDLLVLGVPRGGVVVAYEVAKALDAPLDVYITRKIGAPHNEELAIGAVASDGTQVLDRDLIARLGVPETYLLAETERQRQEIRRRLFVYRGAREGTDLRGRILLLVDDGVATGATVRVGLRALRQCEPGQLILAVPVGPADTIRLLAHDVDRLVCLHAPEAFWAVGAFYVRFDQTQDEEVVRLLRERDNSLRQAAGGAELQD